MLRILGSILLMVIGCSAYGQQPISDLERFELFGKAQGTTYTISYYADAARVKVESIDSIFRVIDASMSLYQQDSKISSFNLASSSKIDMDKHMLQVIKKSFKINKESKGRFDITVKPLVALWGFGTKKQDGLPDSTLVQQTLQVVGLDKLKRRGNTLIKKLPGVEIDLNGIAQGYTVDVLYDFLKGNKISSFIIEVGGEIRTFGKKPDGSSYRVLVARPEQASAVPDYVINLQDKAITTSGSYEKYRTVDKYRFSHHMDPKTGYPLQSNIISVTVIAENAMDADAYDNVFMAMKPSDAIAFANKKNKMDIYLIYEEAGQVKEAFSSGFKSYLITD
ncbi:FAD:protein FMN transferase [Sphingobacterium sp. 1.A.4]|uniref:FAD:protein FMN transferase n=1 Tax=Sphingobacterium sp. 1.A.4 TaxID=2044603 RepID=UPI000C0BF36E|nr:FAD:protein FMN transferase [Sphingobacterium sp. 1.A.4]